MTLRGRLTTAFLAIVLGPVLLGALFVAGTVASVSRHQVEERLNLAATTVRTSINALCQQLHATAGAVALLGDPTSRSGTALQMVDRGLADAVMITNPGGVAVFVTPGAPSRPWTSCTGPGAVDNSPYALAARVEMRNRAGDVVGAVWAGQLLDAAFVRRLAATSGAAVTLLPRRASPTTAQPASRAAPGPPSPEPSSVGPPSPEPSSVGPPSGPGAVGEAPGAEVGVDPVEGAGSDPTGSDPTGIESQSTESTGARAGVLAAARRISGDTIVRTEGGRYVRRVGPSPGQPLPLVLSVPRDPPTVRYALLGVVVLVAGVLAVLSAWRLARSTTRPLAELAWAADRVAEGDLAARVPVRAPDEVGRLADSFNRMTRETQSYLRALIISRHQLRDQLTVLGDTLASTHDLRGIFQVILRTAMAATGARAGVVLLLDPADGHLVSRCVEGLDEQLRTRDLGLAARLPAPNRDPAPARHPAPVPAGGPSPAPGPDAALDGGPEATARQGDGSAGDGSAADEVAGDRSAGDEVAGDEAAAGLRIPLGRGLLGTVAASGQPRRGRLDRDGPPLYAYEPRCRTYVAVPFTVPTRDGAGRTDPSALRADGDAPQADHDAPRTDSGVFRTDSGADGGVEPATIGVLALYDRLGADEFDDTDVATLRSFASHAAVAVDNVRVHEEAQRLSLTDPLTGLWNYRYLRESIRREIERASRFGRRLGVLALDLDRFKEVNDTYGHAAGDAVLAEFAQRIRGATREVDLAFRQGGEEFVVLLPETDVRGAATVAERLGAAVREQPISIRPRTGGITSVRALVSVTVSIGVAVYPDHATTGPHLLAAADEALYAAKAAGRDTYRTAPVGGPTIVQELPVRPGAATPDDGLPWAGNRPAQRPDGGTDGALSGPQPPRQGRGR
ncbi:diguanylate cyclase [Plantactinospora sp. B5E13]|uniref:diguanylate cyclase n=1 Tax=unclassified Plantactinospora TaxID=2631981 RepID=UPI00325C7217